MTPSKKDRGKAKKPQKSRAKSNAKGKTPVAKPPEIASEAIDDRRAARNVAHIREKLSAAIADPKMRDQIVRAMRSLIYEDKK